MMNPSARRHNWAILALALSMACSTPESEETASGGDLAEAKAPDSSERAKKPPTPRGLIVSTDDAAPGYVLYSPLSSGNTYLLDSQARAVHMWESDYAPHSLYLLEDGSLLRPGRNPDDQSFLVGGAMGLVQKFSWEGELLWEWKLSDETRILHHDVEPLANGNFLAIGWEVKSPEEARSRGRRADLIPEKGLWPDFLVEIEPLPPDDARIVWKWNVWDHLLQNHDPHLPNFGEPSEHPERLDINAGGPPLEIDEEQLAELKALGYVPDDAEQEKQRSDFLHINAVDWNPELDQIAMAVPELGEIWIIARPKSTEESAGPKGDLLYRWGNPEMYGRGEPGDKRLFYPHDVQWIPPGMEGAGNLTIFNNGNERPDGKYSSIEEITSPLATDGSYTHAEGAAWGPAETVWTYAAGDRESFFAPFISGAHRLANGNTFATSGPEGRLFEVTPQGETVWNFGNPYSGSVKQRDGSDPWGGGGGLTLGVWRAAKLAPDYPGLGGRDLKPLDPQPPMEPPQ